MTTESSASGMEGTLLCRIPLFAELTAEDTDALAAAGRILTVPAGTVICEEGTPGDQMHVVVSGERRLLELTERPMIGANGAEPGGSDGGTVAGLLAGHRTASLATLCTAIDSIDEYEDDHAVKVVFDRSGRALGHTELARQRWAAVSGWRTRLAGTIARAG